MGPRSTSSFLEYILELLQDLGEVHYKHMFSGYAIYAGDTHIASVVDDTLFVKVSDETLALRLKNDGSHQFSYNKRGSSAPVVIKQWWSVPEEALEQPKTLVDLVYEAFPELGAM